MRLSRRGHRAIEAFAFILIMLSLRDWQKTEDFQALAPLRIYMGIAGGILLITSIFWEPSSRKKGNGEEPAP